MADTADRRSEGKNSKNTKAITARIKRIKNINEGLCISCHTNPVLNRTICYSCSDIQMSYQLAYSFRKFLKNYGIENTEEVGDLLTNSNYHNNPLLLKLSLALIAAKKKVK